MDPKQLLKPAPIAGTVSLAVGIALGAAVAGDEVVYQPAPSIAVTPDRIGALDGANLNYATFGDLDVDAGAEVVTGVNLKHGLVLVDPVVGERFDLVSATCIPQRDVTWCEVRARNTHSAVEHLVVKARIGKSSP